MRRDIKSLNLIIKYCDDVASDMARFGDDIEDLMGDESYQRSTAKSIELIGRGPRDSPATSRPVSRTSTGMRSARCAISWHTSTRRSTNSNGPP